MEIPNVKTLKQGQFSKSSIKKHYPEFCDYIINQYKNISWKTFSELLYLYFHEMDDIPKCPVCGKYVHFINYSKGYRSHCCNKCAHKDPLLKKKIEQVVFEKYGVPNIFQSKKFREKAKQTMIERYGVDNPSKLKETREKAKQTMIERYGVEHASLLEEFKEKSKQTCLERYGEENIARVQEFKEKAKQTCLHKYGTEYASSTPEFREKVKQTCLERYGVTTYSQTDEYKEKTKQTCLERYGVDNIAKLEETTKKKKRTCLDKYGVESNSQTPEFKEKLQHIMIEKYGVNSYFKSKEYRDHLEEIQNKIYKTKKKNHTFSSSKIEQQFKQWLVDNNINFDYQHKDDKYPFHCDFYFPDKDLYLEIQGYFTHNNHPFDPTNEDDLKELELLQKKNHHDIIKTWTKRDPIKRQWAKDHSLNWIEVFTYDVNVLIDKVKDIL